MLFMPENYHGTEKSLHKKKEIHTNVMHIFNQIRTFYFDEFVIFRCFSEGFVQSARLKNTRKRPTIIIMNIIVRMKRLSFLWAFPQFLLH